MSQRRIQLGKWGEDVARRHLEEQGYSILETNYRCPYGEVDIVAREGDAVVFVEVKTRRDRTFGQPEESVTAAKQGKLIEVAQAYLQENPGLPEDWRIDVVAILASDPHSPPHIDLIKNAVS